MTTVVFLSGTLCDERLFAPQIKVLQQKSADIIVPPMTGHPDGLAAFAATLWASLPPRVALVGLSLGGIVALEMMRQSPQRINCAALLDTNASADTDSGRQAREGDFNQAEKIGLEQFIRTVMLPSQLHKHNLNNSALCQTMVDMALAGGMEQWRRQLALVAARREAYEVLAAYPRSLFIGYGEADIICSPAVHKQMAAANAMGKVQLMAFAGSGHISTLENAPAVTAALDEFLMANNKNNL